MKALRKFFQILSVLAVFAMLFAQVGKVAAQSDSNYADWNNPQWADEFATGSRNAVFSTANPLPKGSELPQAVKDAMTHGMVVVLIEPWRMGCPVSPETDPNCNVGYVKSFTDWDKLYEAVYGKVEANKGHAGPWTDGSVHLTRIPELAAGVATDTDWAMFANGDLKITFAENQLLPDQDPTAGAKSFRLIEPWRHTCIGSNSSDPDCNVGKSGVFPDWQSLKEYLSEGGWTRGSVMAQDKVFDAGGNLPTPVAAPTMAPVVPTTSPSMPELPLFGFARGVITIAMVIIGLMILFMLIVTVWAVVAAWHIHWLYGIGTLIVALVLQTLLGIIGTLLLVIWIIVIRFAKWDWPKP